MFSPEGEGVTSLSSNKNFNNHSVPTQTTYSSIDLQVNNFSRYFTTKIEAIDLFSSLCFAIHVEKSSFILQNKTVFLGFALDSTTMKMQSTSGKISKITSRISALLNSKCIIREFAQIKCLLVSCFPGGKCHYRSIQNDKIIALKQSRGNFDVCMALSSQSVDELNDLRSSLLYANNLYSSDRY